MHFSAMPDEAKADAEPKVEDAEPKDGSPKRKKGAGKGKGKSKDKGKGDKGKGAYSAFSGPTGAGSGYRLNVKNLSEEMANSDKLKELFAPFGTVSDAQVKTREDGTSRGFGYVVLKDEAEGEKAIKELNGKEFGGKALSVGPAERREGGDDGKGGKGKGKKGKDAAMGWAQQQAYAAQYMSYMWAMQQAYMQQWSGGQDSGAGSGDPEYEGSLKSISEKNGYGFIVCGETYRLYNRDVYIDKEILPEGAKPADRLKFTVALNAKNHPKAKTASFAIAAS